MTGCSFNGTHPVPTDPAREFDRKEWVRDDLDSKELIRVRKSMATDVLTKISKDSTLSDILQMLGEPDRLVIKNDLPIESELRSSLKEQCAFFLGYVVDVVDNSTGPLSDGWSVELRFGFSKSGQYLGSDTNYE